MAILGTYQKSSWQFDWTNLRNDSVLWHWSLDEETTTAFDAGPLNRPFATCMVAPKNLLISFHRRGIGRLDSLGTPLWIYHRLRPHHGFNLGPNGDVWFPAIQMNASHEAIPRYSNRDGELHPYVDEWLVQLDALTGEERAVFSLTDILAQNGLAYLIRQSVDTRDPFHLNDIEPVLKDGPFFQSGDLFLSLRHLSLVLHFRPATGKICRVIRGPFAFQHDVDILSDSTISLFDNHTTAQAWPFSQGTSLESDLLLAQPDSIAPEHIGQKAVSRVLVYNLAQGTFSPLYPDQFELNDIFTHTEGLSTLLENGDLFVEEQESGLLWLFNEDSLLLRTYIPSPLHGYHHIPNWTRVWVP